MDSPLEYKCESMCLVLMSDPDLEEDSHVIAKSALQDPQSNVRAEILLRVKTNYRARRIMTGPRESSNPKDEMSIQKRKNGPEEFK